MPMFLLFLPRPPSLSQELGLPPVRDYLSYLWTSLAGMVLVMLFVTLHRFWLGCWGKL